MLVSTADGGTTQACLLHTQQRKGTVVAQVWVVMQVPGLGLRLRLLELELELELVLARELPLPLPLGQSQVPKTWVGPQLLYQRPRLPNPVKMLPVMLSVVLGLVMERARVAHLCLGHWQGERRGNWSHSALGAEVSRLS
mgnify:CR=1 FL=1